jgi:acetolactate synthase-1/2/3 large subunit
VKVYEALSTALLEEGIAPLFGVMGNGNLLLAEHFSRTARYVAAIHEAGAAQMASGFASVSGRLGALTVTHGPGLANALPPLIDSIRAGLPVLVVAADTSRSDEKSLQAIDQRALTLPTGAGYVQVRSAGTAVRDLHYAAHRARVERRPVVLDVGAELMEQEADQGRSAIQDVAAQQVGPDVRALEQALGALLHARRPLLLAGRGAIGPGAREALLEIAGALGAPVATTLRGLDLFRDAPGDLGVFGTLSSPATLDAIAASDCVVAFGAGLNAWTTDSGALLRGKRVVHCDHDAAAIGRYAAADVAVVGDVSAVARALATLLGEAAPDTPRSLMRPARVGPPDAPQVASAPGTVPLRTALARLEQIVPQDRVFVCDAGRFMYTALRTIRVPHPQSFVHTASFGSIGLSMGNAIGAAFAVPDRPVLVVCGDGGFMLGGLAELSTAVRYDLYLVVVVVNDGAYGAEHVQLRERGMDPTPTTFGWPALAPLAQALGAEAVTVQQAVDLEGLAAVIAGRRGPLLVDVRVDPDAVPKH